MGGPVPPPHPASPPLSLPSVSLDRLLRPGMNVSLSLQSENTVGLDHLVLGHVSGLHNLSIAVENSLF